MPIYKEIRRSEVIVLRDLLKNIENNEKVMDILYRTRMAYKQFQKYRDRLLEGGFISIGKMDGINREVTTFHLSEKGIELKNLLSDYLGDIKK